MIKGGKGIEKASGICGGSLWKRRRHRTSGAALQRSMAYVFFYSSRSAAGLEYMERNVWQKKP